VGYPIERHERRHSGSPSQLQKIAFFTINLLHKSRSKRSLPQCTGDTRIIMHFCVAGQLRTFETCLDSWQNPLTQSDVYGGISDFRMSKLSLYRRDADGSSMSDMLVLVGSFNPTNLGTYSGNERHYHRPDPWHISQEHKQFKSNEHKDIPYPQRARYVRPYY